MKPLIIMCYKCGWKMKTLARKRTKCIRCGKWILIKKCKKFTKF